MNITLDQWLRLESLAKEAGKYLSQLHSALLDTTLAHHSKELTPELELLMKITDRVESAQSELAPTLYCIQMEWTGGDSHNAMNHTLREPGWVNIAHAFPKEQVDKYRDKNGRLTHRD
jgi:hypothetical protein